jgi:hypothetical protein
MHSTQLEYLCTELECFLQVWNAFDSVGIPLYRVGMLSIDFEYHCTRLKCSLQGWNAFARVGIPLYSVGMLSRRL